MITVEHIVQSCSEMMSSPEGVDRCCFARYVYTVRGGKDRKERVSLMWSYWIQIVVTCKMWLNCAQN